MQKKKVGIVGVNGYSGLELAKLLLRHPLVDLQVCFVRDSNWKLTDELLTAAAGEVKLVSPDDLLYWSDSLDGLFLATPVSVSMDVVNRLFDHYGKEQKRRFPVIIDVSGAFRLPLQDFNKYYLEEHTCSSMIDRAHYGLIPWSFALKKQDTFLISNPGCYATSCLMALIPLLRDQVVSPDNIVIDSKSGTTGAGKKAKENLLHAEVEGECLPYRVGLHQHLPEITRYCEIFSQVKPNNMQFTTHLLPTRRGILSSLYLKPFPDLQELNDAEIMERIEQSYQKAYGHYPLVVYGAVEEKPFLLSLKKVVYSARTHISYIVKDKNIYVFATLDNLLKGAASQAVENWNSLNDWPVTTGLIEN
ncbi:MAG: N-acetyl-gamma-glutamyl-phosphate reductase [Bdellovibrionales bacterium]|nr:N-acetyl-gamma-glutamyl-phosphate reductase [Bdellovibrionales bacterium]